MIVLTEKAVDAVKSAMSAAEGDVAGLRIMVESGGCAGYKYMMGFVSAGEPTDEVVDCAGVKVFVDTASAPILTGTRVDFTTSLEGSGFTFDNPNAASKCSCGKSFN